MAFFANLFKSSTADETKQSQETLDRLRQYRGKETAQWLAQQDRQEIINRAIANGGVLPVGDAPKLEDVDKYDTDDTPPYQPPIDAMYTAVSGDANTDREKPQKPSSQVDWIEAIFDEFGRCAREFNSTNTDQALRVSVYRPEYSFQTSSYDTYIPDAKISVFKGHISTHIWGMLVQGHGDSIDVYVVPSDKLLAFTLSDVNEEGFRAFMQISSSFLDGQLEWHIENEIVSFDKLPLLAKELFCDLIRIASGKMSESELFASYSDGFRLGDNLAHGYTCDSEGSVASAESSVENVGMRLSTWPACRELLSVIASDLEQLGHELQNAQLSGDTGRQRQTSETIGELNAMKDGIDRLLAKYS